MSVDIPIEIDGAGSSLEMTSAGVKKSLVSELSVAILSHSVLSHIGPGVYEGAVEDVISRGRV